MRRVYLAECVFRGDTPDINDFIFYITDASMQGAGYGEGDLNKLVFNNCVLFTNSWGMANTGWKQRHYNSDNVTKFNEVVILTNNFKMSLASAQTPKPAAVILLCSVALVTLWRTLQARKF